MFSPHVCNKALASLFVAATASLLAHTVPAHAVDTIAVDLVADTLTAPNLVTVAGDGSGRLFILDQAGQIRIVDANGVLLPAPFLDVSANLVPLGAFGPGSFDERGLLGLAFHPSFAANGKFYVYYSAPQPPPVPITFEVGNTIPTDVTFAGGIMGTQFTPPLYCSQIRAFEVPANGAATVTFTEPVRKTRFFFVHKIGAGPGTVTAVLDDGTPIGTSTSHLATVPCDPANFVEFQDFNFPIIGIKQLQLQAGAGAGLTLFLDDLEITRYNHKSRISEFTVSVANPNVADPASERTLLEIDEPQFNHNSGTLAFGPNDGFLYITVGDGGNANDVGPFHNTTIGNGQDATRLLGSILRINVDADDFPADPLRNYAIPPGNPFAAQPGCTGGCDEIWAFGVRNSFRCSFDMGGTRQLFCGDVGQDLFEEVNIVSIGQNMGWNTREGLHCFDANTPLNPPANCSATGPRGEPLIDPIIEYPHFADNANMTGPIGQAIIGGNVYRGSLFPGLIGRYVFGDFSLPPFGAVPAEGSIFIGTEIQPGVWQRTQPLISNGVGGRIRRFVQGFGQDADGEVYVCTTLSGTPFGTTGAVFRIVPSKGDMTGDGSINGTDMPLFVAVLTGVNMDPVLRNRADMDGDGVPASADIGPFVTALLGP